MSRSSLWEWMIPRAALIYGLAVTSFRHGESTGIMKLADLNPFLPKDPVERDRFIRTFTTELHVYRRKPSFIIGLPIALICSLVLIQRVGTKEKFLIFAVICCLALVHDTITSHFTRSLIEAREKSTVECMAQVPGDARNDESSPT